MKQTILLTLAISLSWTTLLAQAPFLKDGLYFNENWDLYTGTATLEVAENGKTYKQYIEVKEGLLNGQMKYYHSKGYVEEIGNYSNGKKEGVWIQFASNGQQLGEAYYKNGLKDGIWTVWDEQGIKRYHMVYSMGKKVDTWKMWDENAVLVSERIYNE
jgi:antitoxin component YwqK of YwqJK toxin-antitoxin module